MIIENLRCTKTTRIYIAEYAAQRMSLRKAHMYISFTCHESLQEEPALQAEMYCHHIITYEKVNIKKSQPYRFPLLQYKIKKHRGTLTTDQSNSMRVEKNR